MDMSMSMMDMATSSGSAMSTMSTMHSTTSMDHSMMTMTMPITMTTSSSSMDGMDMSSSMSMSSMSFHTSASDFLFATGWTPSSKRQYAGICIFLIVLGAVYRFMHVLKHRTERYLNARTLVNMRSIATATQNPHTDTVYADSLEKSAGEATVQSERPLQFGSVRPWRVSVDVPLSLIQLVLSAISYLLMLAVMTFNVGYFLSVLGGIFLGELLFGRFSSNFAGH
ncbi:Ctr copper transporter family-domain-containing protein [Lipomyces orientalis]|uniref:Ctr copper transporter family-domain-containing protein n=1 Tax=Lipomyces orientalis TaxID=1233043 RepID=A0ACC3TH22_9ASCO